MTITLSEPFLTLAREQAARGGFADVTAYLESLVERADTIAALREGLADAAAGRVRPAADVLADIARKYHLPPPDGV